MKFKIKTRSTKNEKSENQNQSISTEFVFIENVYFLNNLNVPTAVKFVLFVVAFVR